MKHLRDARLSSLRRFLEANDPTVLPKLRAALKKRKWPQI